MQSGPALGSGSLIAESARILQLAFQDPFYAVYSGEATLSGEKVGITEYFPADLVARAPGGDVLLRSLELQDLFNRGRDRFMVEAKTLSALRHPNLLRFDGIVSDHGTAYALHSLEEGQSLINVVKPSKQSVSQEEVDATVKPLVSALYLLHSKGLIHANITPDTILLRPEPLLIRFGAAKSYLAARMRKVNLATTPGYSAPELHFSDEKAHGPLCDVFSLAAVLYYFVTGRHPVDVIARGRGHAMPAAAAGSSQRFRPQFLEAIDTGLELEPERRPPSIEAFGEMLLGIAEKKVPAGKQPAAVKAALEPQPSTPPVETGNQNDNPDEVSDFASNWRGLGIERLLVVVLVLVIIIAAGLWMLETQFKKQAEQTARLDSRVAAREHVEPDRPAPRQRLSRVDSKESVPTASPQAQSPVLPNSKEPERRTVERPETGLAEAPAQPSPVVVDLALPVKEALAERQPAKESQTSSPPLTKNPQAVAPPSPTYAVAAAFCGLEGRAGEAPSMPEGADKMMHGADQAFTKIFAEGFLRQSCLVRDLHQKAEQLGDKIKEAEEKRDKAREQLEIRAEVSSSRDSGQKQDNKAMPEKESQPKQDRLEETVQENQSLVRTLSAERKRIEAETIAAEQTLNERLKEQKLVPKFEPTREKSASSNNIDESSAQLPANAIPLANARKSGVSKCADILSRLQLGEFSQSDLNALKQCELR
jgi:serine/threonine protein kinase